MYACAFVQILGKMHGFAEYAFARPGWAGGRHGPIRKGGMCAGVLRRAYAAYAVMMKYNRKGEENEKDE